MSADFTNVYISMVHRPQVSIINTETTTSAWNQSRTKSWWCKASLIHFDSRLSHQPFENYSPQECEKILDQIFANIFFRPVERKLWGTERDQSCSWPSVVVVSVAMRLCTELWKRVKRKQNMRELCRKHVTCTDLSSNARSKAVNAWRHRGYNCLTNMRG